MITHFTPSTYPNTSLPLCPETVDTGNPDISEYSTDAIILAEFAKSPSPEPRIRAISGTKSVFFRTSDTHFSILSHE